jgi:hypothetical protein
MPSLRSTKDFSAAPSSASPTPLRLYKAVFDLTAIDDVETVADHVR